MAWRLVEIPDAEAIDADLSDAELIGLSIMLSNGLTEQIGNDDVYMRAWRKLKPSVSSAIDKDWNQSIRDHWNETGKGPSYFQTLTTGAKNARPKS